MSVTVDDHRLEARALGLTTVGEVLSHVARENKLVVQLLIDGSEPDLGALDSVRARRLEECTLFIETAQPTAICREALNGVDEAMHSAEALRAESSEYFRSGDAAEALKRLSGCFALWHHAQDSLGKVARLLRVNLERVQAPTGATVAAMLAEFAGQLRQLRDALEVRDYVLVCDVLTYDMESTTARWQESTDALRRVAGC